MTVTAVTALAAGAMLAIPTAASAVDVGSHVAINGVSGGAGTATAPGAPFPATIEQIQGTAATSPLAGKTVVTKGVVTADYATGGYNGYTIQTSGTGGAIDFSSHHGSDGVFIYSPSTAADPFASFDHDPVLIGVKDNGPAVSSTVTLTASAAGQTFGTGTPATLTATVTMADGSAANGAVAFRADDGTLLGTAAVVAGKATVQVRRLLQVGVKHITGQFLPADSTTQAGSTSAPLTFQVYMALSSTTASATVVKVKGDATHKSGLIVTGTVTIAAPSTLVADGTLNVNVNGAKAATVRVRNGHATTGVIPVPKGTATVIATFIPTDATDVQRSSAPLLRVTISK